MNVSAVNCTPLKPQVSFGNNEDVSYAQVLNLTKGLNDEFVSSEEIKSPVAALASIGLAGLLAYAGGKGVGNILSKVSKGRIVTGFEGLLKGVSTKAKDFSGKLINQNPGKLNKVKNVELQVLPVKNEFWGNDVNVAGLITAQDLINQLKDKCFNNVIIPSIVLRPYTTEFLDGLTVKDVEEKLNIKLHVTKDIYSTKELFELLFKK